MSDLISRSKVISVLEQLEEHSLSGKMHISNAIYLLNNQPIAYDIDKVVEELEKIRAKETCNKEKCDTKEICRICVVDDAIEIVKHGFPDKCDISEKCSDLGCAGCVINKAIKTIKQIDRSNSESIRDKAVEWNKYSSKKVPYEFIDFVEGKREISVSEDYCEWRMVDRLNNSTIYNTSCGKTRSPYTSGVDVYCNGCGKKIKVVK